MKTQSKTVLSHVVIQNLKSKIGVALLVLALFSPLAAGPLKLARLTLENKSGYSVYVYLKGQIAKQEYYIALPVEEECEFYQDCQVITGNRDHPLVKVFTIVPDIYYLEVDYYNGDRLVHHEEKDFEIPKSFRIAFIEPVQVNECTEEWKLGDPLPEDCDTKYFLGERFNLRFYPLGYIY